MTSGLFCTGSILAVIVIAFYAFLHILEARDEVEHLLKHK